MDPVTYENATEAGAHHFVTDASTLGLPPGGWPAQLPTSMGNGQPFVRKHVGHELALYSQAFGCLKLTVFND